MSPPMKVPLYFPRFLSRFCATGGGASAGGDIGETVFATSNTLLEKLPAPWWQFSASVFVQAVSIKKQ